MNVHIHQSSGLGVMMFDTNGTVTINSSRFKQNQILMSESDAYAHIGEVVLILNSQHVFLAYSTVAIYLQNFSKLLQIR